MSKLTKPYFSFAYICKKKPIQIPKFAGTEVVILSGLREKCSSSMSHIEKLYEETKFLKTHNFLLNNKEVLQKVQMQFKLQLFKI